MLLPTKADDKDIWISWWVHVHESYALPGFNYSAFFFFLLFFFLINKSYKLENVKNTINFITWLLFFFLYIQDKNSTLAYSNYIYVRNSLLKVWTLTLTPHIPQTLIFVKWPLHQRCAVVYINFIIWCDNKYNR